MFEMMEFDGIPKYNFLYINFGDEFDISVEITTYSKVLNDSDRNPKGWMDEPK